MACTRSADPPGDRRADDRGLAHAGLFVEHPLDVLGKDVQPSGVTIISFLRPRMWSRPWSSSSPMSPVWNQPSRNAARVSSGALK